MTTWLNLPRPWLFLAPMASAADWAFREVCYSFGAEVAVSHLVSGSSLIFNPRRIIPEIEARHGTRPFNVQLIGNCPEDFTRAARIITDSLCISGVDINMGCPVTPVVDTGSGSALLRDPARAAAIVEATCAGTHLPVSVKLRSGWDSVSAPELAPMLEAAGAKALTIHGRTREQRYGGTPSLDVIAAVKRAVSIPVVGNGNVVSVAAARSMLDITGVDGVMVGRGALGRPWLFADLQAELKHTYRFQQHVSSFGDVIREHTRLAFADLGPWKASRTMRRHLKAYSTGIRSSAELRKAAEHLHSWDDIQGWIATLEEWDAQTRKGSCRSRAVAGRE